MSNDDETQGEPSTTGKRSAARRDIIRTAVEQVRRQSGDTAAAEYERDLFERLDDVRKRDRD